jgi:predicted dehydrogenase
MTQKVRMALIGCGGMGRNHLRNILLQTETTEIVAFCDISPESLDRAAEIFAANEMGVFQMS